MWLPNGKNSTNMGRKYGRNGLIALAIDKDKGSQNALKWAVANLLTRGGTLILIHVQKSTTSSIGNSYAIEGLNGDACPNKQILEKKTNDLFQTFHCYCTRKEINCLDVALDDQDIARAITDYVAHAAIENLVLGSSRHGFIKRLKVVDVPTAVSKASPDFCTVYTISKTKISAVKNASRLAPFTSPLMSQIQQLSEKANSGNSTDSPAARPKHLPSMKGLERTPRKSNVDESDLLKSPYARGRGYNGNMFGGPSEYESDISFISSDRPSTDRGSMFFDDLDSGRASRVSASSDSSFGSMRSGTNFTEYSMSSVEADDADSEMRRLKLELQKTMEMYSTACKEALTSKQKAVELHKWRMEEERKVQEARLAEEAARQNAEQELEKYKNALANAQRVSESGSERESLYSVPLRYRKYSIDEIEEATECFSASRKIGEGGYGPVFKCYLDHTPVAVKVLRPDAAQGRSQFQQEVEVLSCIRHPNIVLLIGACPEYGSLVYEYMPNGSLEDRLFRRQNTRALSWQLRFRIASELATGLNFLHQTKPSPLVHRDLKPGNILLDQNYVSKISDVGLARLVPPTIADEVTQYRMTAAAGTFSYIDPEYQQTGMLGVKSDVYSLGVVLLQIITARPAMGLAYHVGQAIDKGNFADVLDGSVPDWPVEEALSFAKLALRCTELRGKDRPDLGREIVPELNRLRELAEEMMEHFLVGGPGRSANPSPSHSFTSSTTAKKQSNSEPNVPFEHSVAKVDDLSSASVPEMI